MLMASHESCFSVIITKVETTLDLSVSLNSSYNTQCDYEQNENNIPSWAIPE